MSAGLVPQKAKMVKNRVRFKVRAHGLTMKPARKKVELAAMVPLPR